MVIPLLYRRTPNGSLKIIPEEAAIVRKIFSEYISGIGKMKIANMLNEEKIPTINGCEWTTEDIRRILQNEKYAGNMLLQKSYREDHITKKCRKNNGELPQYYVEESHEPIIEPQIFELVQGLIKTRGDKFTSASSGNTYPFTGKIQCGCCGKNYRRKTTATGIVWICSTYNTKGKKHCPKSKQIPEEKLYAACCEALGISEFDENIFQSEIEQIIVPAPNQLKFIFHNGTMKIVEWQTVPVRKAGRRKCVDRQVGFQKRGDGTNARSNQNSRKVAPCDLCPLGKHRKTQGCRLCESVNRF